MEASEQVPGGERPQPRSRSRKWLRRLVILLVIMLVVVLAVGLWFIRANIRLRFSQPYRIALEQVRKDPQVIDRLGAPVRSAALLPSGSIDGPHAIVHFPVKGPKGEATVSAQARRISGLWGLTTLEADFGDGQRVSLEPGSAGGVGDAPKWSPPPDRGTRPESAPSGTPDTELDADVKLELPDLPKLPGE